jgi:hypothetical protein
MAGNNIFDKSELAKRRAANRKKPAIILQSRPITKPTQDAALALAYTKEPEKTKYLYSTTEPSPEPSPDAAIIPLSDGRNVYDVFIYTIRSKVSSRTKINDFYLRYIDWDINRIDADLVTNLKIGDFNQFRFLGHRNFKYEPRFGEHPFYVREDYRGRRFMRKYVKKVKEQLQDNFPEINYYFTTSTFIFPIPGVKMEITINCYYTLYVLENADRMSSLASTSQNTLKILYKYAQLSIAHYQNYKDDRPSEALADEWRRVEAKILARLHLQ